MAAIAAGLFRRTPIERSDQRVSWERTDQAFFAAGACHILAWTCRDSFPDHTIGLAALHLPGERYPFHVYARWSGWAFDAAGWNGRHRLPHRYWRDPLPRAREYVGRFTPPWRPSA